MGKYKIEDGIEIPAATNGLAESPYPFDELKVGQSFAVRIDDYASQNSCTQSLWNARRKVTNRTGKKFTSRVMGQVVRTWRTE